MNVQTQFRQTEKQCFNFQKNLVYCIISRGQLHVVLYIISIWASRCINNLSVKKLFPDQFIVINQMPKKTSVRGDLNASNEHVRETLKVKIQTEDRESSEFLICISGCNGSTPVTWLNISPSWNILSSGAHCFLDPKY